MNQAPETNDANDQASGIFKTVIRRCSAKIEVATHALIKSWQLEVDECLSIQGARKKSPI